MVLMSDTDIFIDEDASHRPLPISLLPLLVCALQGGNVAALNGRMEPESVSMDLIENGGVELSLVLSAPASAAAAAASSHGQQQI